MTTDAKALLQTAITGEPDARLVYADYLEEMGDGFRAEFWRTNRCPKTLHFQQSKIGAYIHEWECVPCLGIPVVEYAFPVRLFDFLTKGTLGVSSSETIHSYASIDICYLDGADAWHAARASDWKPSFHLHNPNLDS